MHFNYPLASAAVCSRVAVLLLIVVLIVCWSFVFGPCFTRQCLVPVLEPNHLAEEESIRINHECEGRIFLSFPHTNIGFFFLLATVFIYLFI